MQCHSLKHIFPPVEGLFCTLRSAVVRIKLSSMRSAQTLRHLAGVAAGSGVDVSL